MANLKHIAATLALLGTASFTVVGCGDKKPTEVPGEVGPPEGGEGSCSAADKGGEGSCAAGDAGGEEAGGEEPAEDGGGEEPAEGEEAEEGGEG